MSGPLLSQEELLVGGRREESDAVGSMRECLLSVN